MKTKMLILGLIFLLVSCVKEEELCQTPFSPPVEPEDSLVIWQIPLRSDSMLYSSIETELVGDAVLYSSQSVEFVENETIKLARGWDGKLVWEWEDYINPIVGQRITNYVIEGELLVANSHQDNYGIDIGTGQSIWSTLVDYGKPFISDFEGKIFHTVKYGNGPYGDSTSVLICDSSRGDWSEVLKFRNMDFEDYEITFHNPAAFINDIGDTLLILKLEQITIAPFDSRLDVYCYNMTQDKMVWSHRQFDPYGGANIRPPLIEGDYVYYVGVFEVYCLNKNTGEVQWKWGYPETRHSLQGNNFLLYQDKLIIKRGNGLLYALDKHTGAEQWVQEDAGSSGTEMRIYGNRLYFGSGKIFIIDLDTGETIYKIRNPNLSARFPQADFLNAITVDEENQRMYTTDGYFLMCMRLPE
ncbi:MAG: PQQ-binding-like beta-propeller repeat protein [Bacteroidota bacterium]